MKLSDIEILKTPCEVHVTTDGMFRVFLRGQADNADARPLATGASLDLAVEAAKPHIRARKVKVSVPFYRATSKRSDSSWEHGVATGFHAGTGNITATFDGGGHEQITPYRSEVVSGDMPKPVRDEVLALRRKISEAQEAVSALLEPWRLNLNNAVTAAIEEATKQKEVST